MAVAATDLAGIPLFASLAETEIEEAARWFDAKTVSEGVTLTIEGASGYSFFVIADGSATVSSDGRELVTLGPGDYFGEMALIGDGRRQATVTTTTPAQLLVMFGTAFRQLQQAHPGIAAQLEQAVASRRGAIAQRSQPRPT
jgi:CRP-like cAMP-binding protein